MEKRPQYNPFEELNDFQDLQSLIKHLLKELEVKSIKIPLPLNFDKKKIHDPEAILPVENILVGNATFQYILHHAENVLKHVKDRAKLVQNDTAIGFAEKLFTLESIQQDILDQYKYFDTMNLIRYMVGVKWKIVEMEEVNGKVVHRETDYPNSKLDLQSHHWNIIDNTLAIRKHLLIEIMSIIDRELITIRKELAATKYSWKGKKWQYELYEVAFSLVASKKIDFEKGDETTFVYDFMKFFGKTDLEYSYYKGKIFDRKKRTDFLQILQNDLENYRKHASKKTTL